MSTPESNNKPLPTATVALITGGIDRHYACAIGRALAASGVGVDMVGNTEMDSCGMRAFGNARLLPFYAMPRPGQGIVLKLLSVFAFYLRIIGYAAASSPRIFHVLWNYKFQYFDRTFLLFYFKVLGKKVVFTAHNVNAAERDGKDSWLNRFTLRTQYRLMDHIFVHTESMKDQLTRGFGIGADKVTVIPFGVGDMVPQTCLTPAAAKQKLSLSGSDRTILFFGRIVGYKGLDLLVDAFARLAPQDRSYRLIVAGEPVKEAAQHWEEVKKTIESSAICDQVRQEIRYIADDEMEVYLKAADVLVLPYKQIYQSGVLFMSHNFGLPVIATDVGTFRDDITEGMNGYVCRPDDAEDLAKKIEGYFASDLYRNLNDRRASIQNSVQGSHSWNGVAQTTADVYARLVRRMPATQKAAARMPLRDQADAAESHDA